MEPMQSAVAQFMKQVRKDKLPNRPSYPTEQLMTLCIKLIQEESQELYTAMWHQQNSRNINLDNPPEKMFADIADGIADLLYVTFFTANVYGLDMEPIFNEVQRSNMTKVGGTFSATGKLIKPDTYEPANIIPIILEQLQNGRTAQD